MSGGHKAGLQGLKRDSRLDLWLFPIYSVLVDLVFLSSMLGQLGCGLYVAASVSVTLETWQKAVQLYRKPY